MVHVVMGYRAFVSETERDHKANLAGKGGKARFEVRKLDCSWGQRNVEKDLDRLRKVEGVRISIKMKENED